MNNTMALKTFCSSETIPNDSLDLDDSGTDALYIALDEDNTVGTPATSPDSPSREAEIVQTVKTEADDSENHIRNSKRSQCTQKVHQSEKVSPVLSHQPIPAPSYHPTPVISEYPRPFLPPYGLPPPISSFYPPHPMFFPGMMPAPHPAFPAYPPPVFPHLPLRCSRAVDTDVPLLACKVRSSPERVGSASPADSGVSTSSSPSPARSSPKLSPRAPMTLSPQTPENYRRTPGGRTSYTSHHVRAMEKVFSENRYPDYDLLEKMSVNLGIPAKKIKVWFQNKRARNKTRFPDSPISSPHGYGHPGLMTPYLFPVPTSVMPFPLMLS